MVQLTLEPILSMDPKLNLNFAKHLYREFKTIQEIDLMEDIQEDHSRFGFYLHTKRERMGFCAHNKIQDITYKVMLKNLLTRGFIEKISKGRYKPTKDYVI